MVISKPRAEPQPPVTVGGKVVVSPIKVVSGLLIFVPVVLLEISKTVVFLKTNRFDDVCFFMALDDGLKFYCNLDTSKKF